MPELPLLGVKSFVEVGFDHVLDPDEPGVGAGGVVDDALADVLVEVGAIVVRFDCCAAGVGGVGVEGVEVGAELFWRVKRLEHGGAGVEDFLFG